MSRQNQRVLDYLDFYGSITSAEAFTELGIMDLPKRVSELRRDGHEIVGEWKSTKNRFGDPVKYMEYRLGVVA